MAQRPTRLKLVLAPSALRDLDRIWESIAYRRSPTHAEFYVSFLRQETYRLERSFVDARQIVGAEDFFYVILRKGQGPIIVFHILKYTIEVLRYLYPEEEMAKSISSQEL